MASAVKSVALWKEGLIRQYIVYLDFHKLDLDDQLRMCNLCNIGKDTVSKYTVFAIINKCRNNVYPDIEEKFNRNIKACRTSEMSTEDVDKKIRVAFIGYMNEETVHDAVTKILDIERKSKVKLLKNDSKMRWLLIKHDFKMRWLRIKDYLSNYPKGDME